MPILGYDQIGVGNYGQSGWKLLQTYNVTPATSGIATRIYVYTPSGTPGGNQCKLCVYDGVGTTANLLASAVLNNAVAGQWNYVEINLPVTAGVPLYPCMIQNGTHPIAYSAGGSASWRVALPEFGQTYANEPLNPFTQNSEARDQLLSLYIDFTEDATSSSPSSSISSSASSSPS